MFLQRLQRSDLCRFNSQNPRIKRTVIREIRGVADSLQKRRHKKLLNFKAMNTNVTIIKNSNIKAMTIISENAASQQVAGSRAEEMMASAIAHEAKMAEIKAAEEQEEKMNLRIIKIKPAGNAKMFRTLTKAIAAGATTLIVTTRVDVAGCGYVWFGIRKGYTELDGKLLLNAQIWNYLMAFLMGKELPEVTEFEPDREICCQSEWLAEVAAEVEKLTAITSEEYNESEEGIGYLAKKYHFPNGKVVMPAEAMEDICDLLN